MTPEQKLSVMNALMATETMENAKDMLILMWDELELKSHFRGTCVDSQGRTFELQFMQIFPMIEQSNEKIHPDPLANPPE